MKQSIYAILSLFLFVCLFTGCGKNAQDVDNVAYVKTQKVTFGQSDVENSYSGSVKGRYETQLAFQVNGKLLAKYIKMGDKVHAGDVLMVIDDKDIKQNVNAYDAQVQSAKSQLTLAQSNLARYQQLYAANAVSAQELDQYQNAYDNAVAAYNQANAQAAQGYNALDYTNLVADTDGVISSITGEVGQVVSAGQTVAVLVQDGEKEVEISIPENKIQDITIGKNAEVTFWALKNTTVQGVVREISPVAEDVSRTYKVRISLTNPPQDIQLGMTANVVFSDISNHGNDVVLPLTALYQVENKSQVWVVNDESKVELKDVQVVSIGKNDVLISGLNKDDVVVTAGVHKLHENQSVKPVDGDTL